MAANSMQIQLNGEPYELPAGQTVADLLARLELGDAIPEPLYRTIAEIIAFAWYLKGKRPEGFVEEPAERDVSPASPQIGRAHV